MKSALAFILILISLAIVHQANAQTVASDYVVQFNRAESGGPVEVSTTPNNDYSPQVALSGNNLYFVWLSENAEGTASEVWFRKSNNSGLTFSEATKIAESSHAEPNVKASGSNVHVAFGVGENLYVMSSADGGETFGDPVNVSRIESTGHEVYLTDYDMTASGNSVYVTWALYFNIAFAKSTDGGKTFDGPVTVSPEDTEDKIDDSYFVHITASGDNIYITWYDFPKTSEGVIGQQVSYAWSNDGGSSFHTITNFSNTPDYYSHEPHAAAVGDAVYVVWRDEGTEDTGCTACIAFVKSTDGGNAFTEKEYIVEGAYPMVAISGQNVYIAFMNLVRDYENMFVVKSGDGGVTFGEPVIISNQTWGLNPYDERPYPMLAAAGNNVYVAWRYTNPEGNHETFFSASADAGESFSTINLSNNEGETVTPRPSLVASGNKVHVSWAEFVSETSTIMYLGGTAPGSDEMPTSDLVVVGSPVAGLIPYLVLGIGIAAGIGTAVAVLLRRRKSI